MPKSYFDDVVADLKRRGDYPAESKHIAACVGCTVETVRKHLRVLRGQGKVIGQFRWTRYFGSTWVYYWIGDD